MSNLLKQQTDKLVVALLASSIAIGGAFPAKSDADWTQDLPPGRGRDAVQAKCLVCHEADLTSQQLLSRPGWEREVDKMIGWGADVSEVEKEIIIDYLAANFGPRPASAHPSRVGTEDRGAAVFKSKCLICHEADLTEQQRLSRDGWRREVEKMIRWGADVSDGEKDPLVDYLSGQFPPK